jgi:hypothetical protein
MITNIQKDWLKQILKGEISKKDDPHKWSVYMSRIRKGVDKNVTNLLWLAENYPEILTDEDYEIQTEGSVKRKRLRALMRVVDLMSPPEVRTVLERRKETSPD